MHGNCCICFVKLIQQLDDNIKTNGWGFINLLKIYNSVELLSTFQLFYHNHWRLPLKNGMLINPDGEGPEGEEKVNLKNLYEMFRYTKSHGLSFRIFFYLSWVAKQKWLLPYAICWLLLSRNDWNVEILLTVKIREKPDSKTKQKLYI